MELSLSNLNNILPKLIEKGRDDKVAKSRFLQRIEQVKTTRNINNGGLFTPHVVRDNSNFFGVAEGGAILKGGSPNYAQTVASVRCFWTSIPFTGHVERQIDEKIIDIQRNRPDLAGNVKEINRLAQNKAVKDAVWSALKMVSLHENYFALQGTSRSPVGVVTSVDYGTNIVYFNWLTTNQGNRMLREGQQIQFYNGITLLSTGLPTTTSSPYSTIDQPVDRSAVNSAGAVHFDILPTGITPGCTVHQRNTFGLMPTGFLDFVDDTGNYKGLARSTDPEIYKSVINRLVGNPTFVATHLREMDSFLEGKTGYDEPMMTEIWTNKAQTYNYGNQLYNSTSAIPVQRTLDASATKKVDFGVENRGMFWNGKKIEKDVHVPPGHVNFINFATWRKVEQTKMKLHPFHDGQFLVSMMNEFGEYTDAKMCAVMTEYNWDCEAPAANGRIEGLAYDVRHIELPN